MQFIVTGDVEIDRSLSELDRKVQRSIGRAAVSRGLTLVKREIKKLAPVGPTGNLKASIGSRFRRNRKLGITEGIVGINVGKRTEKKIQKFGKQHRAPHGHLVALGTQERFTKTGKSTGKMPANDFVSRAVSSSKSAAQAMMEKVIRDRLAKEQAKLKLRGK